MRRVLAAGWENISSAAVRLRDPLVGSCLKEWNADHEFSELEWFRRLLPPELIRDHLLSAFNRQLQARALSRSPHSRYLVAPIAEEEFWRFFAQRAMDGLNASGRATAAAASVKHLDGQLLSAERYKGLSFCAYLESDELEAFMQALFVQLQSIVKIGNYGTVDETILPYRGSDGLRAGILINCLARSARTAFFSIPSSHTWFTLANYCMCLAIYDVPVVSRRHRRP